MAGKKIVASNYSIAAMKKRRPCDSWSWSGLIGTLEKTERCTTTVAQCSKVGDMESNLSTRAGTTTEPEEKTREEVRLLPPYHVILENDDYHSFEFVIGVLIKTIACTADRA